MIDCEGEAIRLWAYGFILETVRGARPHCARGTGWLAIDDSRVTGRRQRNSAETRIARRLTEFWMSRFLFVGGEVIRGMQIALGWWSIHSVCGVAVPHTGHAVPHCWRSCPCRLVLTCLVGTF